MEVIAIFDVGKSSKRFFLFDYGLHEVHHEEKYFTDINDATGISGDDTAAITDWMKSRLTDVIRSGDYLIRGLNFTGARSRLIHLDKEGNWIVSEEDDKVRSADDHETFDINLEGETIRAAMGCGTPQPPCCHTSGALTNHSSWSPREPGAHS